MCQELSLALSTGGYFDATAETFIYRTNAAGQVDDQGDASAALTQSTDPCSQIVLGALQAHTQKHGHAMTTQQAAESGHLVAHTLRAEGHDASEDGTGRGVPLVATTLRSRQSSPGVPMPGRGGEDDQNLIATAFAQNSRDEVREIGGNIAGALGSEPGMKQQTYIAIPLDMRQASRGEKMTNNRKEGSSGGAPGTGIGEDGDPAATVAASHVPAVAFQTRIGRNGRGQPKEVTDALTSSDGGTHPDSKPHVAYHGGVRRLTPVECCRLQGFSDDYLDGLRDSAKYRLLGNAVSVTVSYWIGTRLEAVKRELPRPAPT
jgi:site-specific DNA-cytosine methylase